jgi:4-hydroxy-3-methylbut-2-enyl diphosphate reductase IspH
LKNVKKVGVTAGASTPNWLIDQVVERLHQLGQ